MPNAWRWYVALITAILVVQTLAHEAVQAACGLVLMVLLITATVVGMKVHRPADRVFWYLVLTNEVLFLVGNVTQVITRDILGHTGFPGPAEVPFLGTYVALIFAMQRILRARSAGKSDRAAALDALVIAAGSTIVCWQFWIGASVAGTMSPSARVASITFPALDIVMFGLTVRCLAGRGQRPLALKFFSATLLMLFLGDALYGWQLSRGLYTPHNWLDLIWGSCVLFAGAMALHPSMTAMTDAPVVTSTPRFAGTRLAVMAAAAALAPAMLALNGVKDGDVTELVIAVGAVVMFGAVLARAYLASRDDARANRELRAKQAELGSALTVLRATQQERALLLDSVIRAGEQERMWAAAELHDGPIQQLAALGFGIDRVRRRLTSGDTLAAAEALETTRDELTEVVAGLRKLMSELRPPALDESGLEGALRDYVSAFRRDSGVHCSIEVRLGDQRLPSEIETTVYRVSQEALANVRRHAQAQNAFLTLTRTDDFVELSIRDDGHGFDVTEPIPGDTAHYGLIGMRERVEQRGGRWVVNSTVGAGTTIDALFPIQQPDALPVLMEVSA